jgi:polysaccharide biosynthesis transport protein
MQRSPNTSMNKPTILLSVLKRRVIPATVTFASVIFAALAYLSSTPRLYETTARLMINDRQVSVSDLGRDLAKLPEAGSGASPLANQAELAKSQRVLERALAKIPASYGNIPTVGQLSQALHVKIIPATSILELSYLGRTPKLSSALLNAVMAAIIKENIENIRASAHSVRSFLETEVPKQRRLLEQAEDAENRYRQLNSLVSVEDQTRQLVESLGTTENQERDLSAQLRDLTVQTFSLQQLVGETSRQNAYIAVRVGQDDELKMLRTKLDDLETQVIELRSRLGDQHPDLLALIEQRDEVRQLYENKLSRILSTAQSPSGNIAGDALSQELLSKLIASDIARVALQQKLIVVRSDRANLQSRLAQLPIEQQPLTNLVRIREEAESNLKQMQSKLQEAKIAEAQLVSNVQIISTAEIPTEPQWPKKSSVLVVATMFGLVLSVGNVLLLEFLDNSLHEVTEAEEILGQPSLGLLPFLRSTKIDFKQSKLFVDNVYLVEPYRKLLKTLEFRSDKKLRLLVVSSALSNEGKSTVVAHLATVSAMLSQKTLIIDADLHRPKQQKLFNLSLEPGFAEVIDGKIALSEAVQATGSNLSVLTSGRLSQHPSTLLESAAMQSFLEETAKQFDLVILDTPPINNCADALVLSRFSDGLLFVVRPDVTTRNGLFQAVGELNRMGTSLIGFVANDIDSQINQNSFDFDHDEQSRFPSFLKRLPLFRMIKRWSALDTEVI